MERYASLLVMIRIEGTDEDAWFGAVLLKDLGKDAKNPKKMMEENGVGTYLDVWGCE